MILLCENYHEFIATRPGEPSRGLIQKNIKTFSVEKFFCTEKLEKTKLVLEL